MMMWLVLTWALMPILGMKMGYNGVVVAVGIISLSSSVAIIVAKKYVNFDLISSIGKPAVLSLFMGALIYFVKIPFTNQTLVILGKVLLGGLSYLLISFLFCGHSLFADIAKIYHEIRKNH